MAGLAALLDLRPCGTSIFAGFAFLLDSHLCWAGVFPSLLDGRLRLVGVFAGWVLHPHPRLVVVLVVVVLAHTLPLLYCGFCGPRMGCLVRILFALEFWPPLASRDFVLYAFGLFACVTCVKHVTWSKCSSCFKCVACVESMPLAYSHVLHVLMF